LIPQAACAAQKVDITADSRKTVFFCDEAD
jgi:hypothetical protein